MATRVIDDTKLQNIAVAIQSKDNGGQMTVDQMAGRIEAIPTGSPEPKTVNFYDFKGNLVHSYTAEEVAQLTELPEAPVIEGFTFQEWNYTLQKVKVWVQNHDAGELSVGGLYVTTDGHTRIRMHLRLSQMASLAMPFCIQQMSGTAIINWGDNSQPETITAAGIYSHLWQVNQYPADVVIDVDYTPDDDTKLVLGWANNGLFNNNYYYCSCVESVEYGLNTDMLFNSATFKECSQLKTINLPNNFTSVSSFFDCSNLSFLVIPDNVTSIDVSIFQNCTTLTHISLPDDVTSVENFAFRNCTKLIAMVLPSTITNVGTYAFYGCVNLIKIILPECITSIANDCFNGCTNLSTIVLPNTVTSIGNGVFKGCAGLINIVFPNGFESVGNYAFQDCTNLTTIVFPNTVTSIGTGTFVGCRLLYIIDLTAFTDPQSIPTLTNANVFQGIPAEAQFQVSNQEMYDVFTTATNWSTYASQYVIKGA